MRFRGCAGVHHCRRRILSTPPAARIFRLLSLAANVPELSLFMCERAEESFAVGVCGADTSLVNIRVVELFLLRVCIAAATASGAFALQSHFGPLLREADIRAQCRRVLRLKRVPSLPGNTMRKTAPVWSLALDS